jgi:hypothetical protein
MIFDGASNLRRSNTQARRPENRGRGGKDQEGYSVSYLHPVRLHFAGSFRADVSTVNNVTARFNNATFKDQFQLPMSGAQDGSNWEPAGTGAWRLVDCHVTRACHDGTAAVTPADDPAVGLSVRESGDQSSAKIVDLDPDQQGVSMIFGLTVRLVDSQGLVLMQGDFEPAAFFDLQFNRSPDGGDMGASAYFQSTLQNVEWGDVSASPCLKQMKQKTKPRMLSIRFITDGFQTGGQHRGYGRITGTIGPYLDKEPLTFVKGRHLAPLAAAPFAPVDCSVGTDSRKVFVDIGNSFPIGAHGDFSGQGDVTLVAGSGPAAVVLGPLNYTDKGSYATTAGVYELPAGRQLTDAELAAIARQPLHLMAADQTIASESDDGIYVRAEQFVFRIDPGASQSTDLIVTKFGLPMQGATPQAQAQPFTLPNTSPLPVVTTDPKTNADGRANLTITAVDARNPRGFIDGQVYAITFSVQESAVQPSDFDGSNIISLLMYNAIVAPSHPGWPDVQPIFEQYAHLYPRPHGPDPYAPFTGRSPSHPVVNLNDQDSVTGFAKHIIWALKLPIGHPSQMPVTRDLSDAKRALLLKWLSAFAKNDKPEPGAAPEAVAMEAIESVAPAPRYAATAFPARMDLIRHRPSNKT